MWHKVTAWKSSIFNPPQGLLSSIGRVILCSGYMGVYILPWAFIFLASIILFATLLQRVPSPQESFALFVLVLGFLSIPTFIVVRRMTQLERRPMASVGLGLSWQNLKEFLAGAALGLVIVIPGFLALSHNGAIHVTWNPVSLTPSSLGMLMLLVVGWLGVAFWEELYFRGYLLQTWASGVGVILAVLMTSVSFGMLHLTTYGLAPLAILDTSLMGVLLAILYWKTKSLWVPVGLHFANNFLSAHVLSIPLAQDIQLPSITINNQPVQFEALHLLFQVELREGRSLVDWENWGSFAISWILYALLALLVWRSSWFRPNPYMEALWQQYVPIAQPWAQLKSWWAKRRGQHPKDASSNP